MSRIFHKDIEGMEGRESRGFSLHFTFYKVAKKGKGGICLGGLEVLFYLCEMTPH